jgi:hypothetical protein
MIDQGKGGIMYRISVDIKKSSVKTPYTRYIQWYENLSDPGRIPHFSSLKRFKLENDLDVKFEGAGWSFIFADLDGDGRLSWLCGSESGMLFLFRRAALDTDAPLEVLVSRS